MLWNSLETNGQTDIVRYRAAIAAKNVRPTCCCQRKLISLSSELYLWYKIVVFSVLNLKIVPERKIDQLIIFQHPCWLLSSELAIFVIGLWGNVALGKQNCHQDLVSYMKLWGCAEIRIKYEDCHFICQCISPSSI